MTIDPRLTPEFIRRYDNSEGRGVLIGMIEPLTRDQLAQLPRETAIAILGLGSCGTLPLNVVQRMSDDQVYELLPQLVIEKPDQSLGIHPGANFVRGGVEDRIDNFEIRAALVLSARVAHAQGLAGVENIRIENLDNRQACEIIGQMTGKLPQVCAPEDEQKGATR